jgi:hypothetical protein
VVSLSPIVKHAILIWRACAAENARILSHLGHFARAGDWREHGDLQRAGFGVVLSLSWSVHGIVNTSGAGGLAEQIDMQLVSGTYGGNL